MRIALGLIALTSCSLLVSTSDLTGGAGPDQTLEGGTPAIDGGAEAEAAAEASAGDAGIDPCTGDYVLCERFDTPSAIDAYPKNLDPSTSITSDDVLHVSPPQSAKFVIEPSGNGSPDATLTLTTTEPLSHFVVTGSVRIDRSEPGGKARLVQLSAGGTAALSFNSDGNVSSGLMSPTYPDVSAVPLGKWVEVRVEMNLDATPQTANVTVDGVTTGVFQLGGTWTKGPVLVRVGVSEADSPTMGWIGYWDDVVVRKL